MTLTLARMGVGIGEATASPTAYSLISDYFPKRQRATALAIYSSGLFLGGLQGLQVGGGVQLRQLLAPAGQHRGQFLRRALVAAGQRHPQGQALVQLGQALRVEVGAAQVGVQRVRGILGLGEGGAHHLGQRAEFRLEVLLRLQGRLGLGEQRGGTAILALEAIKGGLGCVHQTLGMGQAGVAGIELGPLVGAGGELPAVEGAQGSTMAAVRKWCLEGVDVCWKAKVDKIRETEREAASSRIPSASICPPTPRTSSSPSPGCTCATALITERAPVRESFGIAFQRGGQEVRMNADGALPGERLHRPGEPPRVPHRDRKSVV